MDVLWWKAYTDEESSRFLPEIHSPRWLSDNNNKKESGPSGAISKETKLLWRTAILSSYLYLNRRAGKSNENVILLSSFLASWKGVCVCIFVSQMPFPCQLSFGLPVFLLLSPTISISIFWPSFFFHFFTATLLLIMKYLHSLFSLFLPTTLSSTTSFSIMLQREEKEALFQMQVEWKKKYPIFLSSFFCGYTWQPG